MAQLQMVMSQADVIAAIQAWLLAQNPPHQMNPTVNPVPAGTGGLLVMLNS
jgi:hypothetical protein